MRSGWPKKGFEAGVLKSKFSLDFRAVHTRYDAVFLGAFGLMAVALLWEMAARLQWMDPVLISSPTHVGIALRSWAVSGDLWRDLGTSLLELAISFGAAVAVGVPFGVIMGWRRLVEYAFDPFVWVLYSAPIVSLWPLFIIWLGIGIKAIMALAFLFAVVPIIINTFTGVRGIDPVLIRCAHSFNASSMDLFLKFTLPAALPMIIAGLRLGIGRALIGVVIGELFSSNAGVGFHISYYGARLRFSDVFAGLFMVVLIGLLTTQAIRAVEARFASWKT
jgi:ABC-type nitrate/sulfonate/bicarbonate transport system permease component